MPSSRRGEKAWKRIHRAADESVEPVRRRVVKAWTAAQETIVEKELITAIESNDQREVERLCLPGLRAADEMLRHHLPGLLFDCLVAGAEAAVDRKGLTVLAGRKSTAQAIMAFEKTNPEAHTWAATQSSTLVVEVSTATREALRRIIGNAFRTGWPPRVAARHIRSQVGLTDHMARAVENRRMKLIAKGVPAGRVAAQVQKLTQLKIRQRALNIARTETIRASNEGQRQLWKQAISRGFLTGQEVREWIVTPDDRLCKVCLPMNGLTAPISGKFVSPDGAAFEGPPLHPSCRCAVGLKIDPLAAKAAGVPSVPGAMPAQTRVPESFPDRLRDLSFMEDLKSQTLNATFTGDQRDALGHYMESGLYEPLNSYLRTGNVGDVLSGAFDLEAGEVPVGETKVWFDGMVSELDQVIGATRLPENATLYRGLGSGTLDALQVGGVFMDEGFVSSSFSKEIADSFGFQGQNLVIKVAKGQRGLYAAPLTQSLGFQEEFIFPRGTRFVVESIKGDTVVVHVAR